MEDIAQKKEDLALIDKHYISNSKIEFTIISLFTANNHSSFSSFIVPIAAALSGH